LQDSLVEQNSKGNFVLHGCQDILIETIGRPEHPSRVRAVGKEVGIQQYFRLAPQNSFSSSSVETKEEMVSKIQQQLMEDLS